MGGPRLTDSRRAALHFGVGQALDGRGDYPAAAEYFAAANAAQAKHRSDRGRGYDPADYDLYASRLIRAFSPDYFRRVRGWGDPSRRPLFIVGMPRSGTTLTEQILASHPRVHGEGERRFLNRGFLRLPALVGTDRPPIEVLEELTPRR